MKHRINIKTIIIPSILIGILVYQVVEARVSPISSVMVHQTAIPAIQSELHQPDKPSTSNIFPTPIPFTDQNITIQPVASSPLRAPLPTAIRPILDRDRILQDALSLARKHGLQQSALDKFAIKQMTLAEWCDIAGIQLGPDAGQFGLDPKTIVWVVTMRGSVEWAGPGRLSDTSDRFDNITIVLSETGVHIGTLSVRPGQPLPLNVP